MDKNVASKLIGQTKDGDLTRTVVAPKHRGADIVSPVQN